MINLIVLSVVLLLGATIIFLVQKRPRRKQSVALRVVSPKPKTYFAVGIRPNSRACAVVKDFYGKRFLVGQAPVVPVDGCTVQLCPCLYEHFADRRMDDDRRSEFGIRNARNVADSDRRRYERRQASVMS